jgi:hypothetical protein
MTDTFLTCDLSALSTHRGEREGPIAQQWEGEVGTRRPFPHLTAALSAPRGGEGAAVDGNR